MRVLLVEDDPVLAEGLRDVFAGIRYTVDRLPAAEPALAAAASTAYDLFVVDLGLPGMGGLEFVRRLRARGDRTPLLVLTARDALEDRVQGLNDGADDYMVKPFAVPELVARAQALVRRGQSVAQSVVSVGPLVLDMARHEATLAGEPLALTGREWNVLVALMLAMPRVLSKDKLTDSLSRWDKEITTNAVEIYVSRLRAKLQGQPVTIRTVRGIGYRLEEAGGGSAD
jgi:DNA-binding response OmpR family regulator